MRQPSCRFFYLADTLSPKFIKSLRIITYEIQVFCHLSVCISPL
jgi:hypothetical protein